MMTDTGISQKTPSNTELFETVSEIAPILSQYIDEEEKARRLSIPVRKALIEAGFFKLYLPNSLGGLEADPITTARVVEEVSRYNTAAGWALMVANSSSWFGSRLPEKGIEEIYQSGPNVLIAAAFHPPMQATRVSNGYRITGRSPLASNIHDANWLFVSAFVMDGDKIKMQSGIPEVIGVFIKAGGYEIIDTWHTLGMRATDSNDVSAKDTFVSGYLSYTLAPEFEANRYFRGPLYQYCAIGAFGASLVPPNALALARNSIHELKMIAEKKTPLGSMVPIQQRGSVQRKLGQAEALVESSRAFLYKQITDTWNKTLAGQQLSFQEKANVLLAGAHTVQSCSQAVDMMYSAAGSTAIYNRSKLEQYFRDAQVIRQHGFFNESRYETAAQIYFGLQPDLPIAIF